MAEMERIEDLERRLVALERAVAGDPSGVLRTGPSVSLAELTELRQRSGPGYEAPGAQGAVAYLGGVCIGERELMWIGERGVASVLDSDAIDVARLLAALGHPIRIAIVRSLLEGSRSSAELAEVAGAGSAGQLYHHLKDLIAMGIVQQAGRSRYEVSADRVVPLLVILAAAGDVARPHDGLTPDDVTKASE